MPKADEVEDQELEVQEDETQEEEPEGLSLQDLGREEPEAEEEAEAEAAGEGEGDEPDPLQLLEEAKQALAQSESRQGDGEAERLRQELARQQELINKILDTQISGKKEPVKEEPDYGSPAVWQAIQELPEERRGAAFAELVTRVAKSQVEPLKAEFKQQLEELQTTAKREALAQRTRTTIDQSVASVGQMLAGDTYAQAIIQDYRTNGANSQLMRKLHRNPVAAASAEGVQDAILSMVYGLKEYGQMRNQAQGTQGGNGSPQRTTNAAGTKASQRTRELNQPPAKPRSKAEKLLDDMAAEQERMAPLGWLIGS